MPDTYRKKLIEVALPLEVINKESAREKSIRHGHPSTLHLWWARRPLAACRAVLFAQLVDDPSAWPEFFPTEEKQEEERQRLFRIIEDLVVWENSNNDQVLLAAHREIARSIARSKGDELPATKEGIRKYLAEKAPPILDPFCGGGSIPLEAQRLGLRAYGSDLNPVPVLITKALIEFPPKFAGKAPVNPEARKDTRLGEWQGASGLAEDVRYYGEWMRREAEKRIGHLYPKVKVTEEMAAERPDLQKYVGQELTVIAWLWARTVASPNPAAGGAHIPLIRSFWLSKKKGKEAYVEPIIDRQHNTYTFKVKTGKPKNEFDPNNGTVERTGARCLLSETPIDFKHVRDEGKAGRMSSRLMAVVCEGERERIYLPPNDSQEQIAMSAEPKDYPETDMPEKALGFRVQLYGMDKHYKLFTPRQLLALTTFSDLVGEAREKILEDATQAGTLPDDPTPLHEGGKGTQAYADAVVTYLGLVMSKQVDLSNSLCRWEPVAQCPRNLFGRQAIPMIWDYAEGNILGDHSSSWSITLNGFFKAFSKNFQSISYHISGSIQQLDSVAIDSSRKKVISTDPPYYDNIGYADLSDFFYVWLRRSLSGIQSQLFATLLTPKSQELIASPYRHNGSKEFAGQFFEHGLGESFCRMNDVQDHNCPLTVYYAFKQSEKIDGDVRGEDLSVSTGWETMLSGLINAGFSVHGTWPIRTENSSRMVGQGTSALASSVVLVCRPRSEILPITSRREFITELKSELPRALKDLQHGGIAPVDLAQAAIGPGMAVYTRYSKILESDGSKMTVRSALGLINQALDEVLSEQEGDFDADTRWAVAWFTQQGFKEGAYGVAETLSKAKNTAVEGLVEAGIVSSKAGKVRLLRFDELDPDWNPAEDRRFTVWEATHHLIQKNSIGETEAAALLADLGGKADDAKQLAYLLFNICQTKNWSQEAQLYNGLIISWPELVKLKETKAKKGGLADFMEE